jgi:very-short-patch-repair endonuclease
MSQRDWNYYNREFNQNMRSLQDIADEWGTYPNKIKRELIKLGFKTRNHSEAQAIALKTGKHCHPTKGRQRPEDVKIKISEAMAESWDEIDETERSRRAETARTQWAEMTAEQRENFNLKSIQGLRESARSGSNLEKYLQTKLREAGYTVQYHCSHVVAGTKLHLDLLIPELRTAIEIDGPSHSIPIWGEASLAKVRAADKKKNKILLDYGYVVIRLQHLTKSLSDSQKRKYLKVLLTQLEDIKLKKTKGLITIGIEEHGKTKEID